MIQTVKAKAVEIESTLSSIVISFQAVVLIATGEERIGIFVVIFILKVSLDLTLCPSPDSIC